jgi:hypothetical protein
MGPRTAAWASVTPLPWSGRFQGLEDDADEESFEADRLSAAFPLGSFPVEIGLGVGMVASLGDRDSIERGVELAVAAAVEPVTLGLS